MGEVFGLSQASPIASEEPILRQPAIHFTKPVPSGQADAASCLDTRSFCASLTSSRSTPSFRRRDLWRRQLRCSIFGAPASDNLSVAASYLSGSVRAFRFHFPSSCCSRPSISSGDVVRHTQTETLGTGAPPLVEACRVASESTAEAEVDSEVDVCDDPGVAMGRLTCFSSNLGEFLRSGRTCFLRNLEDSWGHLRR